LAVESRGEKVKAGSVKIVNGRVTTWVQLTTENAKQLHDIAFRICSRTR
jgi:hypothetical protein